MAQTPVTMPRPDLFRLLVVLWGCFMVFMLLLAIAPFAPPTTGNGDKVLHLLAGLIFIMLPASQFKSRRIVYGCAALFIASGVSVELLQQFISVREPSMIDIYANVAGVVLGMLLGRAIYHTQKAEAAQ